MRTAIAPAPGVGIVRHLQIWLAALPALTGLVWADAPVPALPAGSPTEVLLRQYCLECHDADTHKGGLSFEKLLAPAVALNADAWERVVRQLRARQMPPVGKPRPEERAYNATVDHLAALLDRAAQQNPNPGTTDTFRRLTRTEFQNAIQDLLAVEVDASTLLPKDDASHGFDHVTAVDLSPTLLERYISAVQKISRLAVGTPGRAPDGDTLRIPPDVTQEEHVEGLPLGTRGGTWFNYTFPRDGDYDIQIRLTRDRNEEVEGLSEPHELELLLDRKRVGQFTVVPPAGHQNFELVDAHLKVRLTVSAGPHPLGVTFLKSASSLLETLRQPYRARFNRHRHPRSTPAVYQISIVGPYNSTGPGDTPSRRRLFTQPPATTDEEASCAQRIFAMLGRRAFRRAVTPDDWEKPMRFFREARSDGTFEMGIEAGLSAILLSPEFLFRIERAPEDLRPGSVYPLPDTELATRLSLFLWGSIPDDELLDLAIQGRLRPPQMLEQQTRRMLADPRARNLSKNFAAQWLHLRNLDTFTPDLRLFPDFDDNLRQAFRAETELLFDSIVQENRSVLDLLQTDHTFLNERLARHYDIPHVLGSQFRRVQLEPRHHRGGLLRHGSILSVTSFATRTSPVNRGNWVLGNLLGTPAPPPPADVPTLADNSVSDRLPMRERLAVHRANPACASCHNLMDPVGFPLENFDAIGRWRSTEDGQPLDVRGGLPDGRGFNGVEGLEQGLLSRPELFTSALVEKLLTFALGRGLKPSDAPAVRKIVHDARAQNYPFAEIIVGITRSVPFTWRKSP